MRNFLFCFFTLLAGGVFAQRVDRPNLRRLDVATGISFTVAQPVCGNSDGFLVIHQPGKERCKYKVIQHAAVISDGDIGYNRRIGPLHEGSYTLEFYNEQGTMSSAGFTIEAASPEHLGIRGMKEPSGNFYAFEATAGQGEYAWDFGDGSKVVHGGPRVRHFYQTPGEYEVRVQLNTESCELHATTKILVQGPVVRHPAEQ